MVVSLAEVKAHLRKTTAADDDELEGYIEAATVVIEDYIGPVILREFVERQPEGRRLRLHRRPVKSIVAVEPWLSAGTAHSPDDLAVDEKYGIVERLDGQSLTGGPFRVVYQAGRAVSVAQVAEHVKKAALMIIGHMWETQRGRMSKLPIGGGIDNVPVSTSVSFAVPRRALELLRPDEDVMKSVAAG